MKIREEKYCNKCGRKIDWEWVYGQGNATAKAWSIFFPSQTAGGSAGHSLDDYCWECYGKVCARLQRIYDYEEKHQVEFDVKINVKVKKL